ncbi:MAG: arsenate reductase [Crocinitomicaceae bacterium]|jgi:arsenate reductase
MDIQLPLILVVCTGNSCRSQMAHAFLSKALAGRARVDSAGSDPAGYVHPFAIQVMQEKGFDLSAAKSQHIEEFDKNDISVVVTVCSNARVDCPCLPSTQCYHWEFADPADATGNEDEILSEFRRIRDEIENVFMSRLDKLVPTTKSFNL